VNQGPAVRTEAEEQPCPRVCDTHQQSEHDIEDAELRVENPHPQQRHYDGRHQVRQVEDELSRRTFF